MCTLESFLANYHEGYACHLFARGTTGLYVLFKVLNDINGRGEVIIPAICCETVALAAVYAGLTPVFVDVEKENLCLSYSSVVEKFSENTVAIVLVNIFGNVFDTTPFFRLKAKQKVVIIEDIAQATGGYDAGCRLGQRFDFTLLSFDDVKIIKGRGGALIQRTPIYGDLIKKTSLSLPPSPPGYMLQRKQLSLRNLTHALFDLARTNPAVDISQTYSAMIPYYEDVFVRQADIESGELILQQFQHIADERKKRYEKYSFYRKYITNELFQIIEFSPGTMCWRLPVLVDESVNLLHVTASLHRNKILASNHYFPLDKLFNNAEHQNSASIGARILNLWVDDLATRDIMEKTVDLLNSYSPTIV